MEDKMKKFTGMLLLALFCSGLIPISNLSYAAVEEGALYADGAPEGSAFVRVFNDFSGKTLEDIDLGGKNIAVLTPLESSAYVFLPAGNHTLIVDGKSKSIQMKEGEFYTVILDGKSALTVIKDEAFTNRRKALLSLYNLVSKEAVDLKTADGSVAIIEDVGFLGNKTREINPVRLSVMAVAGNAPLGQSGPVSLQWGKVFSLFACGDNTEPKLVWVENKIDTSL
jgi:alginate O-acetyltransferase complex protein AlgF